MTKFLMKSIIDHNGRTDNRLSFQLQLASLNAYVICVLIFFIKSYIVGTHLNYLYKFIKAYVVGTQVEAIQMSAYNIRCYKEVDNITLTAI